MGAVKSFLFNTSSVCVLLSGLLLGCQTTTAPKNNGQEAAVKLGTLVQANLSPKDIRGGTTKGAAVDYDKALAKGFTEIQEAKTKKEKDRKAILAQTGDYKVTFEFVETLAFNPEQKLAKPYYSWATEYIFPLQVSENFISLQHILVMTMQEESGKTTEPYVVKHWRQDWTYEAPEIFDFLGFDTWKKRKLTAAERTGSWKQSVYQVDDSPRYQAVGKWTHNSDFSVWEAPAWRPLPRREHTVRSDYDVMDTRNRVIITPTGWYHEQDSTKLAVDPKTFKPTKYIAREAGLNSYDRIKNFDFSVGHKYWQATQQYWQNVRNHWDEVMKKKSQFSLASEVEGKKLYKMHFEFADQIVKDPTVNKTQSKEHAIKTIDTFVK